MSINRTVTVGAGDRPDLNKGDMEQEQFGLNQFGKPFPKSAFKWQSEPAKKVNPTHTYPILFNIHPGDPQKNWNTGMPMFIHQEVGKKICNIYDLPTFIFRLRQESEAQWRQLRAFILELTGKKDPQTLINYADQYYKMTNDINNPWATIEKIRQNFAFLGPVYSYADPSLQDGPMENQYAEYSGEHMPISMVQCGHCFFPNLFETTQDIKAGQRLYMIIRLVDYTEAREFKDPNGSAKVSLIADDGNPLATSMEVIFYTNQNNEPPNLVEFESNNILPMQTSRYCAAYMDYLPTPIDPTAPTVPRLHKTLKNAIVYDLGHSLFTYRYKPTNQQNNRVARKYLTATDILKLEKMEINFQPREIYL